MRKESPTDPPPRPPLDWEAVQTVVEVARQRSVRGAARALRIHHTTVGRRVEQLEAALATRLFDRTPEGYALTGAGERLVASGLRFADELLDVRRRIEGDETALSGTVSLTVAEPLANLVLLPGLPAFQAAHPGLDLRLLPTFDFLDLARHEADIAVRMDNNPPEALVGKRLYPYRQTVYASPAYLADRDLATAPERGTWLGWTEEADPHPPWVRETEFARVPVRGVYPTVTLQQAAARAGLGLALLPCLMGDADPGLVRASRRPPQDSRDVWILTHADLRRTARIRAVMAWLEQVLRAARPGMVGDVPAR